MAASTFTTLAAMVIQSFNKEATSRARILSPRHVRSRIAVQHFEPMLQTNPARPVQCEPVQSDR
jgi:hypothetical protein